MNRPAQQLKFELPVQVDERGLRAAYNKTPATLRQQYSFEECLASEQLRLALTLQAKASGRHQP